MKGPSKIIFIATFLVFVGLISQTAKANAVSRGATFDVTQFGAVGDGKTDDSKAFLTAWEKVCNHGGNPTLKVPRKRIFFLKPITLLGPCKSSIIRFWIAGHIIAPTNFLGWGNCKQDSWIYFENVKGLSIIGQGRFQGHGELWWGKHKSRATGCKTPPTALIFNGCKDLQLKGTTHLNSPWLHIKVVNSQNVEISGLNIKAPGDSPNTDGIVIASSSNVHIHDSVIGTGDDCIAIKAGASRINITHVHCGPGHGISIGSLGEQGPTVNDIVEHIFVKNCTLDGTTNGARIKTWQGGLGHTSDITFEDITLVNSKYPIIIDQSYTAPALSADVQVTDVTFRGFRGTSATEEAISLQCSANKPCKRLKFEDIKLKSATHGQTLLSKCQNAHGVLLPPIEPNVRCLLR